MIWRAGLSSTAWDSSRAHSESGEYIVLTADWVPTLVDVLEPLPPKTTADFLNELLDKLKGAASSPRVTRSTSEWSDIAVQVRDTAQRLMDPSRKVWSEVATHFELRAGLAMADIMQG
jgi:hypothetical protein